MLVLRSHWNHLLTRQNVLYTQLFEELAEKGFYLYSHQPSPWTDAEILNAYLKRFEAQFVSLENNYCKYELNFGVFSGHCIFELISYSQMQIYNCDDCVQFQHFRITGNVRVSWALERLHLNSSKIFDFHSVSSIATVDSDRQNNSVH